MRSASSSGVYRLAQHTRPSQSNSRRRLAWRATEWLALAIFVVVAVTGLYIVANQPSFQTLESNIRSLYNQDLLGTGVLHEDREFDAATGLNKPDRKRLGVERFPVVGDAERLMLASHNRLLWYYYHTGEVKVLHEGQGVYYGLFPGDELDASGVPTTVWVVSRPHNWRPKSTKEWLLHIDMQTGEELGRVELGSRFAHDAVRRGGRVYVCNTGQGSILELSFPELLQIRALKLFSVEEHVNTLAALEEGSLWAVLHNLGQSELVKIDLSSDKVVQRHQHVGAKAHGIVEWSWWFLALDSDNVALVAIHRSTGEREELWKAHEHGGFLKGLAVVDHVAYFGISGHKPREARSDPADNSELAAYHLVERRMLWRREVPTHGLLNIVAAPHLGVGSTYYAMDTGRAEVAATAQIKPVQGSLRKQQEAALEARCAKFNQDLISCRQDPHCQVNQGPAGGDLLSCGVCVEFPCKDEGGAAADPEQRIGAAILPKEGLFGSSGTAVKRHYAGQAAVNLPPASEIQQQFSPVLGGHWKSGLPFLDGKLKREDAIRAGVQLLLGRVDVSGLKRLLLEQPAKVWSAEVQRAQNAKVHGRDQNLDKYKPGVEHMHLVFSDQDGEKVYQFPWYTTYQDQIEPLLHQVVGAGDTDKIIRMQFARMPPGTQIRIHRDLGGYSLYGHRIHFPVIVGPGLQFLSCPQPVMHDKPTSMAPQEALQAGCLPVQVEEGLVFELNNNLPHLVFNTGTEARVHLIVDLAETPRPKRIMLHSGQRCAYVDQKIVCNSGALSGSKHARLS
ncbi:hypothetical protein WJX72_007577 [[Myrmecia] bisecta]|uniref:Aspartyl/asparaginy/proline hydroxylase domain-containing protein n=1 Tax=[Myrmecia] bisecta TaxID=41462 RepID=A0AAW1PU13_9CHLO